MPLEHVARFEHFVRDHFTRLKQLPAAKKVVAELHNVGIDDVTDSMWDTSPESTKEVVLPFPFGMYAPSRLHMLRFLSSCPRKTLAGLFFVGW